MALTHIKIGDKANLVHNGQQVRGRTLVIDDKRADEPGMISLAQAESLVMRELAVETTAQAAATERQQYSAMTKAQLEAEAQRREITVARTDGTDGAIRKEDLVAALEQDDDDNA